MSKLGLIVEREYLTRVYKKSFIVMTILTPVVLVLIAVLPMLLAQIKDSSAKEVAVIDRTGLYAHVLESNSDYRFITVRDADASPLDYFKHDGSGIYAILSINHNLLSDPSALTLYSEKTVAPGLEELISKQLNAYLTHEKIESYHIPELQQIIDNSNVRVRMQTIKWSPDGQEQSASGDIAMASGLIATLLIYAFIFAYGGMVMQGVMQEKTNRIVEVIVSSVKPFELMMGKIIGVGLVGLTQFLIWGAILTGVAVAFGMGSILTGGADVAALSASASADADFKLELMQALSTVSFGRLALCFMIFFVGGYLLFASIFAMIGSMVDQEADTQQFMIPVTMIILFAFYAGMYSVDNPDGPLAFWCSMIPLTSPIVMMVRVPFDVPLWQLLLSIGLLYATAVGMVFVAAKIYRTGILMYGKKVSFKEAIRWLRY